jgi:hypothetical protein
MTDFCSQQALGLFGRSSAFAMIAALAADLFILRPVAMSLSKIARRVVHRTLAGRRSD